MAHKATDWLRLLSVLVAVQATAGPMQPQAESSFTGKSRPDMHSCTNHLGCQQRLQNTMSLLMASEVDVHKKDQELEAACCVRHENIKLRGTHGAKQAMLSMQSILLLQDYTQYDSHVPGSSMAH